MRELTRAKRLTNILFNSFIVYIINKLNEVHATSFILQMCSPKGISFGYNTYLYSEFCGGCACDSTKRKVAAENIFFNILLHKCK